MMRRRRKRKALKWTLWIVGVLGSIVLTLGLIKIDDVVMAQGIVEPGQKIYIDSPMNRVLHEILAVPGDPVRAGQPVATLYDGDLKSVAAASEKEVHREDANLESARARLALLREKPTPEELKIAESQVDQAQINLEAKQQELKRTEQGRDKHIYSQGDLEQARTNAELARANLKVITENLNLVRRGASPAELREAEASVRQTQAALGKARQNLEAAREGLERTIMRSPVDGVVARQDLHPGMLAGMGQIVMIVAGSREATIIDAWMPETSAWKVRQGQPVEILSNLFTDREGFLGMGKVGKVYGYAVHEGGARTFELEVGIQETPLPLRYGSTADLRIIVGRRSILKILLGLENSEAVLAGQQDGPPINMEPPASQPDGRVAVSRDSSLLAR